MKRLLLLTLIFTTVTLLQAQKRYLEPVFNDVNMQTIAYGKNWTILTVPVTGKPTLQPLAADVYTPVGDTLAKRPLMLYFHTGNFLPFPQNLSPNGTRSDSTTVTLCRRWASMGYVVASCDYRLGWNPTATTQEERVNTLINAAYRGVQDAHSAIRYFKLNADLFKIDTNRIVIFGQGTGGYISLNTGALDKYSKILNTQYPPDKFKNSNGIPYVLEAFNGNIEATTYGVINFPGHPLDGDTLCIPNNVGPTSHYQFAVNIGGAIGDLSWIDENTPPTVSFQSPTDPFAPYETGVVVVPGLNLNVVEVQGALLISQKMDELNLNSSFAGLNWQDDISLVAQSKNGGLSGLFPIQRPADKAADSAPWDFWAPDNPNNANGLQTNPDMSKEKATLYMDTIVAFSAPRACLALNLDCDLSGYLGNKAISAKEAGVSYYPNPATDFINFQSEKREIKNIVIFDAAGRAIKAIGDINANTYKLTKNSIPPGYYFAQIRFDKKFTTVPFSFVGK